MTRWTNLEDYTAKALAWTMMRERVKSGVPIMTSYQRAFLNDLDRPHRTFDWGGRRGGKTARTSIEAGFRNMGFDLAKGRDKSVRAKWINGRLWILD